MKKIPLNLLEAFATFADAKNMREAAEQLKISQPALSHQLRALQEFFPNDLLAVAGKKKILTAYGQDVLQSFRPHLSGITTAIEGVNNKYKTPQEITVRISGRLEVLRRLVEPISFKGNIHYISQESVLAIQDLLERKTDIAISRVRPDSLQIISKPLMKDQLCVVIPKKWKMHFKNADDLIRQIPDRPYLGYNDQFTSRFSFIKQTPHRAIEDWSQIIHLIEKGVGWSIVPNSFQINDKLCEIVKFKDPGNLESQFYLCYSKDNLKFDWFKDIILQASNCFKDAN
jgi:Transcriptional regulator